ncbi:MAG: cytochrome C [Flavobacteriia bacterium]|nr:cytochrome C [Flavobacteriia bacterium]
MIDSSHKKVRVFMDNDPKPFAEFDSPVKFILDTTKIPDGKHEMKIVSTSSSGKEGIKVIPFEVRNGPMIYVLGLKENDSVSEKIPITINSYGSERHDVFEIVGSETPRAIPQFIWIMILAFIAFGLFYLAMYWKPDFYTSFF